MDEDGKEEFLKSPKETNCKRDTVLDKMVEQVTGLDNVISIINQCKEIIRTQIEKIIVLLFKQGFIFLLKNIKKTFLSK